MKKSIAILIFSFFSFALLAQGKYEIGLSIRQAKTDFNNTPHDDGLIAKSINLQFAAPLTKNLSWTLGLGYDAIYFSDWYKDFFIVTNCACEPFFANFPNYSGKPTKHLEFRSGLKWRFAQLWRFDFLSEVGFASLYDTTFQPSRHPYYSELDASPFLFSLHSNLGFQLWITDFIGLQVAYGVNRFLSKKENTRIEEFWRTSGTLGLTYAW